jgi:hypothetical protein
MYVVKGSWERLNIWVKTFRQFIEESVSSSVLDRAYDYTDGDLRHRRTMMKLAKRAAYGGDLHHLHPGSITVHRGVESHGSAPYKHTGTSWSKLKKVARNYGDTHHSLTISKHTPAIDVDKLLKKSHGGGAKQGEHEVFVDKGNHKVKTTKRRTS